MRVEKEAGPEGTREKTIAKQSKNKGKTGRGHVIERGRVEKDDERDQTDYRRWYRRGG